jgi:hypothetical protein
VAEGSSLAKVVDLLSILALAVASSAFAFGAHELDDGKDLQALYWLAVGGLLLRSAVELLRPRTGVR